MSGEVKRTLLFKGFALPELPEGPFDISIVDLHDDSSSMPASYILGGSSLRLLEQRPLDILQQNLGVLRRRIIDDPEGEGVREAMESYWARVEATTLSDLLLVESRIWAEHLESESLAVRRVALRVYYRIIQHENYPMRLSELFRSTDNLRAGVGQDDLDLSSEALVIYQRFVETFFKGRPDLVAVEISGFRAMAEEKIRTVLSQDQAKNIDENAISHINNLLAVYAEIIFCSTIDLAEIEDGIKWVEGYMRGGHPLEQCAVEVRASLRMTKDMLVGNKDLYIPVAPSEDENPGNVQKPVAGEIDTTKNGVSLGEMPSGDTPKVVVQGAIQLIGSRLKPV